MKEFIRRLRPDHLAGQIALLILAAIILFHLVMTTVNSIGNPDERRPMVEPGEFLASAFWIIDAAAIDERARTLASLNNIAPRFVFSLRDDTSALSPAVSDGADISGLRSHLWDGARIFVATTTKDGSPEDVAVGLRKGGYAVASSSGRRSGIWMRPQRGSRSAGGPSFFVRLVERSALFFILCATILTVWVSSAVVAPLVRLAREAERFPDESVDRSLIDEAGPREVRDLARALNRMQSRIHGMIEARSHALAAISHDLRTIITRIRLRSEFISDDSLKSKMLHDVDLMDSMLYKNLQHLRDARHAPERGLIDLDSVLQTVCDQYIDLGYDVTFRGGQHQIILGSLTEMQRVFSNLVENAATHAKAVIVTLRQPSPELIQIDVEDDGPGIAAGRKSAVLEPFVRGEPARNMNDHVGFGLGLSIVRSLVEESKGSLELLDREPQGLIARVTLPRAFPKN